MSITNQNTWICSKSYFASWEIEFLPVKSASDVDTLLKYMQLVPQSGDDNDVLKIALSTLTASGAPDIPYVQQVEWLISHKKIFTFFDGLFSANWKNKLAQKSSKIAFFDERGNIEHKHVTDIGLLFDRFHKSDTLSLQTQMYYVSPLEIELGTTIDLNNLKNNEGYTKAYITLYTDIWFPKIVDYVSKSENPDGELKLIDNHKLALLHTPRLNNFLSQVQDLTIQSGGTWSLLKPKISLFDEVYSPILIETGIVLD